MREAEGRSHKSRRRQGPVEECSHGQNAEEPTCDSPSTAKKLATGLEESRESRVGLMSKASTARWVSESAGHSGWRVEVPLPALGRARRSREPSPSIERVYRLD